MVDDQAQWLLFGCRVCCKRSLVNDVTDLVVTSAALSFGAAKRMRATGVER
jgi:hypothetical protein